MKGLHLQELCCAEGSLLARQDLLSPVSFIFQQQLAETMTPALCRVIELWAEEKKEGWKVRLRGSDANPTSHPAI